MLSGVTIDPNATYRVTVNGYLAGGTDAFTVLAEGTNRLFGVMDIVSCLSCAEPFSALTGQNPGGWEYSAPSASGARTA